MKKNINKKSLNMWSKLLLSIFSLLSVYVFVFLFTVDSFIKIIIGAMLLSALYIIFLSTYQKFYVYARVVLSLFLSLGIGGLAAIFLYFGVGFIFNFIFSCGFNTSAVNPYSCDSQTMSQVLFIISNGIALVTFLFFISINYKLIGGFKK